MRPLPAPPVTCFSPRASIRHMPSTFYYAFHDQGFTTLVISYEMPARDTSDDMLSFDGCHGFINIYLLDQVLIFRFRHSRLLAGRSFRLKCQPTRQSNFTFADIYMPSVSPPLHRSMPLLRIIAKTAAMRQGFRRATLTSFRIIQLLIIFSICLSRIYMKRLLSTVPFHRKASQHIGRDIISSTVNNYRWPCWLPAKIVIYVISAGLSGIDFILFLF